MSETSEVKPVNDFSGARKSAEMFSATTRRLEAVCKERDRLLAFIRRTADGGSIVSSGACTESEIASARACGRFFVTDDCLGYVYRPASAFGNSIAVPKSETCPEVKR